MRRGKARGTHDAAQQQHCRRTSDSLSRKKACALSWYAATCCFASLTRVALCCSTACRSFSIARRPDASPSLRAWATASSASFLTTVNTTARRVAHTRTHPQQQCQGHTTLCKHGSGAAHNGRAVRRDWGSRDVATAARGRAPTAKHRATQPDNQTSSHIEDALGHALVSLPQRLQVGHASGRRRRSHEARLF
jgi:hypothetical protein